MPRLPLALLSVGLMLCGQAFAHDDGRFGEAAPEIKSWVKGLTDQNGAGCCDTADGYPAEVDWDADQKQYRVKIEGTWYDVPDRAVITKPNRLGYAVVWFYWVTETDGTRKPTIRCFIPGAGG